MKFGAVTMSKAKKCNDTSKYLFINMSFITQTTTQ